MYRTLINLGLDFDDEKIDIFKKYEDFFKAKNETINLVGKNDISVLFEKHIYDSLALNLFLKEHPEEQIKTAADMGTGGGFPAIPLALCFRDMQITAADSTEKKIEYIKSVKDYFNMTNLTPVCSRFEDLKSEYKNSFDIVVSRAVAELNVLCEYTLPFVKKGGYFVAYKSVKAEEELKKAQNALKTLNAELTEKYDYLLPLPDGNKRVLLVFKKTKETSSIYPRKNGIPKKNPL